METTKPPELSAPSKHQIDSLSPVKSRSQASGSGSGSEAKGRLHSNNIATLDSNSFFTPPQSPSNGKNRVIVVPTAPRSSKTVLVESCTEPAYQTQSASKRFPRSSFGSPPNLQERDSPFPTSPSERKAASTSYYPKTPTRGTVNIAPTPSRLQEYLPVDSQEDETILSPPRLDFEDVLASCKEESQDKSGSSSSKRSYSIDILKPDSQFAFDAQQEGSSGSYEIPLSPGKCASMQSQDINKTS
jgi:hypothetical protein